jgi:hypothetical protein
MIVLSFRGTVCGDKYTNAKSDINFVPTSYWNKEIGGACKVFTGCAAHRGFYKAYKALRDEVRNTAIEMVDKFQDPSLRFLVTGISLGGAMAAHASYDLSVYFDH